MSEKDKKLLYHLTLVANLPGVRARGLLSRRDLHGQRVAFRDVASAEILEGRAEHRLDGMVPFHFISRSPFDYRVVHEHPGECFCLLTVRRTYARERGWRIIPRHPLAGGEVPQVLDWATGFEAIDWDQLEPTNRDYRNNHACKMACMAEALSDQPVPFSDVLMIFVPSDETKKEVQRVLGGPGPTVKVNAGMFPKGCR